MHLKITLVCFINFQIRMFTKYKELYLLLIIFTIERTHVHIHGRGIFILSACTLRLKLNTYVIECVPDICMLVI